MVQKNYHINIKEISTVGPLYGFNLLILEPSESNSENVSMAWCLLNSPSAAYMCQWTGSSLIQLMACRLFGAKPLPEPMLAYCELHAWEQISVKFETEFYHFHLKKCIWNCRLPKWRPYCPGGDEVHGDAKAWRSFPHYRPFVRGVRRSPKNFPRKGHASFAVCLTWTSCWTNKWLFRDLRFHDAYVMPLMV